MIPRRQQGTALTIVILILGAFVFLNLPLSPTLSFTALIDTRTVPPTVSVTSFSYEKAPMATIILATRDVPYLVGGPTTSGEATLTVVVSYGASILSEKQFPNLTDGAYQIKVLYAPRPEDKATPYVVTLTLSYQGRTSVYSVNIFP